MTEEIMTKVEETEADAQPKEAVEEKEEKNPDAEPKEVRPVVFEEALEAILFAAGHPISYATLARVFEMTPGKVKDKVFEYSLRYNDPAIPRGVILLTYGDSCQLSTKQYYLNEIREALGIKKSGSLSTSSMEALAIVAYNQPVTRIFVDTLRRADSSYAMNNLIDRGLIEAKGRLDAPGRPMLYGTTTDFLRAFGLKDVSELPKTTDEMDAMFAKAKSIEEESSEAVQEEIQFPEDNAEQIAESASEENGAAEAFTLNSDQNDREESNDSDYDGEPSAEDDINFDLDSEN
jgi:segregation and condensation protein B